jgi:hypothetical protein
LLDLSVDMMLPRSLRSMLFLASAATAFVAPTSRVASPRAAPVASTAAEVSIAASQQRNPFN